MDATETRVNIVTTDCKRCEWTFRYVRKPGPGRRRLYCEVCQVLEQMDCVQVSNESTKAERNRRKQVDAHPA